MRDDTLSRIIDAIPDSVLVINDDFSILETNKAARLLLKLTGLDGEAVTCHKLLCDSDEPCDSSLRRCSIKEVISTGKPVTLTYSHCIVDDRIHEVHVAPFKEESGKIVQLLMSFRDITEGKQAEEKLRENEKQLHTLLQSIQVAVVVHGPDTSIVRCNKKSQELLELTEDQMLGKKVFDPSWRFFNENGNAMSLENYPVNQVVNKKKALKNFVTGIHRPQKKDVVWVLVNAVPEFGPDGNISQVIVTFMDITDRKRAEEQLKESEETKKALLNAPTDTALLIDIDGTILVINEIGAQRLGKRADELVGLHIDQYLPPDLAKKRLDHGKVVVSSGKPVFFEDERKGKYFENRVYPILDTQGTVSKLAVFAHDITENKKAEEEKEKLICQLQEALEKVKTLSGLLPICSECKKIRDDKGYWNQLEEYVEDHSEAEFSHGICPECMKKIYGDQKWYKRMVEKKSQPK